MIYLLHFDKPVGKAQHYLGVTDDARLNKRLREHAQGGGSALTRAAFKQGSRVFLARTIEGLGYAAEKQMKQMGGFKKVCPLCCPMLAHFACEQFELEPRGAMVPPVRAVMDFRPSIPRRKIP